MGFKVLVSRNLAILATGLLAIALASLTPAEHTSLLLDTQPYVRFSLIRLTDNLLPAAFKDPTTRARHFLPDPPQYIGSADVIEIPLGRQV